MRIQKIKPGNYIRVLDRVEEKLLQRIMLEEKKRQESDYILQAQNKRIADSVTDVSATIAALQDHATYLTQRVNNLEGHLPGQLDVYTRSEIAALLGGYLIEEIRHPYAKPLPVFFDRAGSKVVGFGYFPEGRLRKWPDQTFGPSVMRRYSIAVFCKQAKNVNLNIHHEDHFVVCLNHAEVASLSGNNTAGAPASVVVQMEAGWNTLSFLMANDSFDYRYDIGISLSQAVDATMTPQLELAGATYQLEAGSVKPHHLDPSASYSVRRLYVTDTAAPALHIGNDDTGSLQLGGAQIGYDGTKLTMSRPLAVDGAVHYEVPPSALSTGGVWRAEQYYLPPATLVDDPQAAGGKALYAATGAASIVGEIDAGYLVPGDYQLRLRGRCHTAAGTLVTVNIQADDAIVASRHFNAGDFGGTNYAYASASFAYPGGRALLSVYTTGAAEYYGDIAIILLQ